MHDLSRGRWGVHRTRSQRGVPGKAVWFALPLHAMSLAYKPPTVDRTAAETVRELRERLAHRGARHMIGNDLDGGSVLSVSRDLTIWCRHHLITWTRRAAGPTSTRTRTSPKPSNAWSRPRVTSNEERSTRAMKPSIQPGVSWAA